MKSSNSVIYETPTDLTSARSELHNLSRWLEDPVTKQMLEELHLAAAASRAAASRPVNELAQINGTTDLSGHRHPISFSDALALRNELLVEARGVEHLSRIIDLRRQILTETITNLENA